ncbi:MAG: enoyl-CoA hydratase/isomerase family protein, partial [Ilumatobacteraceae bacterium]
MIGETAGDTTGASPADGNGAPKTVLTDLVDGVAIITLNRPERHNALDDESSALAQDAVRWAVDDMDARAILLQGAGKSFSSGRDTAQLGRRTPGDSDYQFILRSQKTRILLMEATKPVIGALKGAVLGGACEMALSCDYRVAADNIKMGFPEVGFGIMTDTGGAPLATILAGPSRAKYMLMTGERIGAEQALAWGLVDEVVTPDEL